MPKTTKSTSFRKKPAVSSGLKAIAKLNDRHAALFRNRGEKLRAKFETVLKPRRARLHSALSEMRQGGPAIGLFACIKVQQSVPPVFNELLRLTKKAAAIRDAGQKIRTVLDAFRRDDNDSAFADALETTTKEFKTRAQEFLDWTVKDVVDTKTEVEEARAAADAVQEAAEQENRAWKAAHAGGDDGSVV